MFKAVSELCDVISFVFFCPDDSTILCTLEANTNEYWIPSSKIGEDTSWYIQCKKDVEDILGTFVSPQRLLRLYKVWIPHNELSYIYHSIYFVSISGELKKKSKNTFGKYRGKVKWVADSDLIKLLSQENMRSPEVVEFYNMCKESPQVSLTDGAALLTEINEFFNCGNFVEVNEAVLVNTTQDGAYEQIVHSASFNKEVQASIFREYTFLCFPAMYMCQQVFTRLVLQLGWSREEAPFLFRAADVTGRCGLTFREFLYIISAIEPTTSHGGSPAEIRCRYMFRFFDRDRNGVLSFAEFKNLILAVRKSKSKPIDAGSVGTDAETCFKTMGFTPDNSLCLSDFLRAVGDLKLRGTSQIFRSSNSFVQYLQDLQDREAKMQKGQKMYSKVENNKMTKPQAQSQQRKQKPSSKNADYELGVHTIRLQKSGTLISIDQIWNIATAVSHSSTQQPTLSESYKRFSLDQFNQASIPNEVLKSLRYLMQTNKATRPPASTKTKTKEMPPFTWGQLDPLLFGRNIITVTTQAKDIFKTEARMIDIQSPAYIMGDLHGNFGSLAYFERILWHLGPGLSPCNLLFLGDYVDRGPYGVEVIAYLFSYKVQAPGKMFLLRGNHEIRDIQRMFTFYTECVNKFGDKLGVELWNAINAAFDNMPIAAQIDEKVFCCHGGIPPPWLCPTVAAIQSIPCPLSNPDDQSSLAWELMWNDPISKPKQISDEVALELQANDGFAANKRRGTAHIFSAAALERFLSTNGYSHIIRAHEVAQAGFNVLQKGKLLTVFSSAKYCGGINEAACILADQGRLRVLRLETG